MAFSSITEISGFSGIAGKLRFRGVLEAPPVIVSSLRTTKATAYFNLNLTSPDAGFRGLYTEIARF